MVPNRDRYQSTFFEKGESLSLGRIYIEAYFINRVEGLLFTHVDHCVSFDFNLGSRLWKNTPWIPSNPSFFGYQSVPVSSS